MFQDGNQVLDKDEASLLLKECLSTLKYVSILLLYATMSGGAEKKKN